MIRKSVAEILNHHVTFELEAIDRMYFERLRPIAASRRPEHASDQRALAPLLRGGPLFKDAVSRLVGRLREDFETWRSRDLGDEDIRYVFIDGWYPKVRIGGRRQRIPVLVTLGVRANAEHVVLDMRLVGEESAASWTEVVASLAARHLARPALAVVDGNPGLTNALRSHWPGIQIQRCTQQYADLGIRSTSWRTSKRIVRSMRGRK